MDLIDLLRENSTYLYITVGIFSLLIGSFLNAAVYRIPIMLEKEWHEDCEYLLNKKEPTEEEEPFNLFVPRSQCPQCGHIITALENIPVFSYLFLRGKCSSCKTGISIQYPLIEAATMLISLLVAWKFGATAQMLSLLFLTWTLITLSLIDFKKMILPDNLTLPLLWVGIALNYFGIITDLRSSVIGAMAGYLSLWSVYWVFKLLTKKEGFGYGDFKLLAALGAWGGWQILPFTIFASSLLGAIFGILIMVINRSKESAKIPFGPWLALAGFIGILWRDDILAMMQQYFMIGA